MTEPKQEVEPVDFHSTKEALAKEGIQVKLSHERTYRIDLPGEALYLTVGAFNALDADDEEKAKPSDILTLSPKGGSTKCLLVNAETGEELAFGATRVHPQDLYCKKTGRELALALALVELREKEAITA